MKKHNFLDFLFMLNIFQMFKFQISFKILKEFQISFKIQFLKDLKGNLNFEIWKIGDFPWKWPKILNFQFFHNR